MIIKSPQTNTARGGTMCLDFFQLTTVDKIHFDDDEMLMIVTQSLALRRAPDDPRGVIYLTINNIMNNI